MLIEMTDDEKLLWGQIVHYWNNDFNHITGHSDKWKTDQIGRKQRALMNSLLERKAIPAHRFKWLDDPVPSPSHWKQVAVVLKVCESKARTSPPWCFRIVAAWG